MLINWSFLRKKYFKYDLTMPYEKLYNVDKYKHKGIKMKKVIFTIFITSIGLFASSSVSDSLNNLQETNTNKDKINW